MLENFLLRTNWTFYTLEQKIVEHLLLSQNHGQKYCINSFSFGWVCNKNNMLHPDNFVPLAEILKDTLQWISSCVMVKEFLKHYILKVKWKHTINYFLEQSMTILFILKLLFLSGIFIYYFLHSKNIKTYKTFLSSRTKVHYAP